MVYRSPVAAGDMHIPAVPEGLRVEPEGRLVYWRPNKQHLGEHVLRIRDGSSHAEVRVSVVPLEAALFVFAHSDDEFGIIAKADRLHREGVAVYGVWTCTSRQRREESRAAWSSLGIPDANLHYTDPPNSAAGLIRTRDAIAALLREHAFQQLYVVAYEGGHLQHDLTHFALVEAAAQADFTGSIYEFGLYNFHAFPKPTLLRPIPATPPMESLVLEPSEYERLQALTAYYPSQRHITTGFRLVLTERHKRTQVYRLLPRWDYTRRPYSGRPLWYRVSPRHRHRFEHDFLPLVLEYYRLLGHPLPRGPFEQDYRSAAMSH